MPQIIEINDINAPELEIYARLTGRQLVRSDMFVAESVNVIQSALDAGLEPVSLLCEKRHIYGKAAALVARMDGVPVYTSEDETLASLTGYELHRGCLCAFRRPAPLTPAQALEGAQACAVLEDVNDAENIGAIFRSAAALGVGALLMTPSCADALSRRSVRVSLGAVFRIKHARIPEIADGGADILRAHGFTVCALALRDESVNLAELDARKPALLLGSEGGGLRAQSIAASDICVRIPMSAGVDSLNIAAAAAVAFWEIRRRDLRCK
ncbi:MAG: RNA methyltransferase [Clostridia bacterium]|nr:RNA methyltransferase [Clostridia bacterium]